MSTPPITTVSAGAGAMSAGTAPAGLHSPATVAASPDAVAGSRYINPQTGDYEIDSSTSQYAQMPPTRQRVLLALHTVFASSTGKPQFGLRAPRKMGTSFEAQTKQAARYALRHLTREDGPVIRIDGIQVDRVGVGKAVLTVSYTDRKNGRHDRVSTTA